MYEQIKLSYLNDFIFCPISIYFHNLYGEMNPRVYQSSVQIAGKNTHKAVDNKKYSGRGKYLTSLDVYCEKYNLIGKIDIYDIENKTLVERKKKIQKLYDGQVFQLYGQYFAMKEMGFEVKKLNIHSIDDNKNYEIELPENNEEMFLKFENTINAIKDFSVENYLQTNKEKCSNCIYEPACDRGII